jgi:uncharacterized protein YgbK (DUF1537 family)
MAAPLKIVVLDDDPTGSQTVHSCPLLLRWDGPSLRRGLAHPSPFLFILADTRALPPEAAALRVAEICQALLPALEEARCAGQVERWLIVSRGDSTLRGHFPLEVETIAAVCQQVAPGGGSSPPEGLAFDACFLVPAFLPGGRTTRHGLHLLDGVPVHTTPFARDRLFGYSTSHLPDWVAEKSGGRIAAAAVERIDLAELDAAARDRYGAGPGFDRLRDRLARLQGQAWVVVDAEQPQQLAALGAAILELTAPGGTQRWGRPRRFLFHSAASLLNALVEIGPQPRDPAALVALRRRGPDGQPLPGLVLVGSHVPLADAQVQRLLAEPGCVGLELSVAKLARVLEGPAASELLASLEREWRQQLEALLEGGRTPVLFTSRGELPCASVAQQRRLGRELAGLMARLGGWLAPRLGYLIGKGGITSQTLLADGLELAVVELQGQLLPGLSLLLTPAEAKVAGLPVLTFPGNLGNGDTLRQAWSLMEGVSERSP